MTGEVNTKEPTLFLSDVVDVVGWEALKVVTSGWQLWFYLAKVKDVSHVRTSTQSPPILL